MTTTTLTVTYEVPNLAELAAKYAPLTSAATPKEYEAVRLGARPFMRDS